MNRFWKAPNSFHTTEQDVEFRFCFDVFCNSFVAIIVDIDCFYLVAQTLRSITSNWFVCIFLTNTLFAGAMIHFVVLAVPNILILPYISKFGIMTFVLSIAFIYIITIVFSIDLGKAWMLLHFG